MGEAKRRTAIAASTIYHHTSVLYANLIWMSGVLKVEGTQEAPFHPEFGEILPGARLRRAMRDFPPLLWFSRDTQVPRCLFKIMGQLYNKNTGEFSDISDVEGLANAVAMGRFALGFNIKDIDVMPWPDHYGYHTEEGRDLNKSARAAGDNPTRWLISHEEMHRRGWRWLKSAKTPKVPYHND